MQVLDQPLDRLKPRRFGFAENGEAAQLCHVRICTQRWQRTVKPGFPVQQRLLVRVFALFRRSAMSALSRLPIWLYTRTISGNTSNPVGLNSKGFFLTRCERATAASNTEILLRSPCSVMHRQNRLVVSFCVPSVITMLAVGFILGLFVINVRQNGVLRAAKADIGQDARKAALADAVGAVHNCESLREVQFRRRRQRIDRLRRPPIRVSQIGVGAAEAGRPVIAAGTSIDGSGALPRL